MSNNFGHDQQFESSLPQEPDIEVGMGQWAQAEGGETIGTFGVASCIGMAAYNSETGIGYVGHTVGGARLDELEAIREELERSGANPENVRVWLTGGLELLYAPGDIRQESVGLFQAMGVPAENITTQWITGMDEGGDLFLETNTGVCRLTVFDASAYYPDDSEPDS